MSAIEDEERPTGGTLLTAPGGEDPDDNRRGLPKKEDLPVNPSKAQTRAARLREARLRKEKQEAKTREFYTKMWEKQKMEQEEEEKKMMELRRNRPPKQLRQRVKSTPSTDVPAAGDEQPQPQPQPQMEAPKTTPPTVKKNEKEPSTGKNEKE